LNIEGKVGANTVLIQDVANMSSRGIVDGVIRMYRQHEFNQVMLMNWKNALHFYRSGTVVTKEQRKYLEWTIVKGYLGYLIEKQTERMWVMKQLDGIATTVNNNFNALAIAINSQTGLAVTNHSTLGKNHIFNPFKNVTYREPALHGIWQQGFGGNGPPYYVRTVNWYPMNCVHKRLINVTDKTTPYEMDLYATEQDAIDDAKNTYGIYGVVEYQKIAIELSPTNEWEVEVYISFPATSEYIVNVQVSNLTWTGLTGNVLTMVSELPGVAPSVWTATAIFKDKSIFPMEVELGGGLVQVQPTIRILVIFSSVSTYPDKVYGFVEDLELTLDITWDELNPMVGDQTVVPLTAMPTFKQKYVDFETAITVLSAKVTSIQTSLNNLISAVVSANDPSVQLNWDFFKKQIGEYALFGAMMLGPETMVIVGVGQALNGLWESYSQWEKKGSSMNLTYTLIKNEMITLAVAGLGVKSKMESLGKEIVVASDFTAEELEDFQVFSGALDAFTTNIEAEVKIGETEDNLIYLRMDENDSVLLGDNASSILKPSTSSNTSMSRSRATVYYNGKIYTMQSVGSLEDTLAVMKTNNGKWNIRARPDLANKATINKTLDELSSFMSADAALSASGRGAVEALEAKIKLLDQSINDLGIREALGLKLKPYALTVDSKAIAEIFSKDEISSWQIIGRGKVTDKQLNAFMKLQQSRPGILMDAMGVGNFYQEFTDFIGFKKLPGWMNLENFKTAAEWTTMSATERRELIYGQNVNTNPMLKKILIGV
jgi:hypothetical protein